MRRVPVPAADKAEKGQQEDFFPLFLATLFATLGPPFATLFATLRANDQTANQET